MDQRHEEAAPTTRRGLRKRGFLILTSAFAALAHVEGVEAQDALSRIDSVVLVQGYGTGYGGMITVEYRPAILFKDGSYTRDAAGVLGATPRRDGRWTRSGAGWVLTGNDGKSTSVPAKMRARPATRGATLDGVYRKMGGVGTPGTGVAVVATYESMQFARDGSVQMGKAAGASTSSMATSSRSGGAARYQLDGYSVALRHGDGRSERRLFYFFPDSDNAIGVGGTTLSKRR